MTCVACMVLSCIVKVKQLKFLLAVLHTLQFHFSSVISAGIRFQWCASFLFCNACLKNSVIIYGRTRTLHSILCQDLRVIFFLPLLSPHFDQKHLFLHFRHCFSNHTKQSELPDIFQQLLCAVEFCWLCYRSVSKYFDAVVIALLCLFFFHTLGELRVAWQLLVVITFTCLFFLSYIRWTESCLTIASCNYTYMLIFFFHTLSELRVAWQLLVVITFTCLFFLSYIRWTESCLTIASCNYTYMLIFSFIH